MLVAVGTTAYLAIALLHDNQAISDRALTQTATPLIFAAFLLVLVSVLGRLPGSAMRIFSVLPLILVAAVTAAWLASSASSSRPGETVLMAALILGVGGLTALLAWGGDRLDGRWERRRTAPRILARMHASHDMLALVGIRTVGLWIFRPGSDAEPCLHGLKANEDGLFDVTDLGVVSPPR